MSPLRLLLLAALILVVFGVESSEAEKEFILFMDSDSSEEYVLSTTPGEIGDEEWIQPERSWTSSASDMTRSKEWKDVGIWVGQVQVPNMEFSEGYPVEFELWWRETDEGQDDSYDAQVQFRVRLIIDGDDAAYFNDANSDNNHECEGGEENEGCEWNGQSDLNVTEYRGGNFELEIEYRSFSDIEIAFGADRYGSGVNLRESTINLELESIYHDEEDNITNLYDGLVNFKVVVGFPYGDKSLRNGIEVSFELFYQEQDTAIYSSIETLEPLLKGDSRVVSFFWPINNGTFIAKAVVNPYNNHSEDDETDNAATEQFFFVEGCTDPSATNYNSSATWTMGGNCLYLIPGCMNSTAVNFVSEAEIDDGSCFYGPIALAGQNSTGAPGVPLQFSGAGTDEDGTVKLYEWDFYADGVYEWSSEENGVTTFIYNDAGRFTATFRVTDNDGNTATDSLIVSVKPGTEDINDSGWLPSISIISTVIILGLIAIFRRK